MPPSGKPERTCVGCRERGARSELLRIVRSPAGKVSLDIRGDAAGRGCYVHPSLGCVVQADRRGAIPRSLRTGMSREEAASLRSMIERTLER
ncbi:MAG: YlxR family protein [Actinomycetota bacterium]|nr:YlxR family protein [Actinomycetota bacterium]